MVILLSGIRKNIPLYFCSSLCCFMDCKSMLCIRAVDRDDLWTAVKCTGSREGRKAMAKLKSAAKLKKSDSVSTDPRSRCLLSQRHEVSSVKKVTNHQIGSATNARLKTSQLRPNSLNAIARNAPDISSQPFGDKESFDCTYESILHDQVVQLQTLLIRTRAASTGHDNDEILSCVGARAKVSYSLSVWRS